MAATGAVAPKSLPSFEGSIRGKQGAGAFMEPHDELEILSGGRQLLLGGSADGGPSLPTSSKFARAGLVDR
jgi:hypothetical protein